MSNVTDKLPEIDRTAFMEDFAKLLIKHQMKNALIVYVGHGQVFNTTFNEEQNDAAEVLNHMSDTIDSYFKHVQG